MANTSAPLSEVAVASMAAGILDDYHISDLDEDRPITRFMAREFGVVRDEVLQLYPWHPAMARASLSPSTETPAFGWSRNYPLPSDCLRVMPLRVNGEINGADLPHEVEGGSILCNELAPLRVRYIKRLTNIALWRPLMARVLAARLAMYAASRVTGKLQYVEKARGEYQSAMYEATHADSLERGTVETYGDDYSNVLSVRGITY